MPTSLMDSRSVFISASRNIRRGLSGFGAIRSGSTSCRTASRLAIRSPPLADGAETMSEEPQLFVLLKLCHRRSNCFVERDNRRSPYINLLQVDDQHCSRRHLLSLSSISSLTCSILPDLPKKTAWRCISRIHYYYEP